MIDGVLTQTDENGIKSVAYTSRKLNPSKRNYHTPERELLAIIHAIQEGRPYLHGSKFTISTDRHPLKYLDT